MKYIKPVGILLLLIVAGAVVYIFKHTSPIIEIVNPEPIATSTEVATTTATTTVLGTESTPEANLKLQASILAKAFIKKDYETVIKYTHPTIVTGLGGKEKALENLKKGMASADMTFTVIDLEKPSAIINTGTELQSVIVENLEMKIPTGTLKGKSALIAISMDKGKNWFFIDRSGAEDLKAFQTMLPTLSSKLVLPAKVEPTFVQN
ncbi:MAG: hypothetical protein V4576_00205 [Patescibacteria group bacterium]